MIVFNLSCDQDHRFEGWFGSSDDYESQSRRGLVTCPICGSVKVQKGLSAPRLNFMARGEVTPPGTSTDMVVRPEPAPLAPEHIATQAVQEKMRAMLHEVVQHVMQNTENVGRDFPEEARKIHYNEAPARSIRGIASREEAQALEDEGIAVATLPMPVFDKSELN